MHLGDVAQPPLGPASPPQKVGILQSLIQAAGSVVQIINQKKLADENIRRSREGLPPIDHKKIPGLVPTAEVQVTTAPETRNALMLTGLGIGALFLIGMMGKRRR